MKHSDINWAHSIALGKQLVGKPYVFGAEVNVNNSNPDEIYALDCSELVEWLFAQTRKTDGTPANLRVPDGSYNQSHVCNRLIPGTSPLLFDLGFKWHPDTEVIHHVGLYIGDEMVLEAKGKKWGVVLTPREKFEASPDWAYWGRLKVLEDA